MPRCGFCLADGQSKEHLWVGWLGRAVLESRAQGGMKTFKAQIERGGKTLTFPKNNLELTVNMPCEPCNNGWMSELENTVKPFMTDMAFRGENTILDEARQTAVVRWLTKTAMVNEFTGAATEQMYFTQAERTASRSTSRFRRTSGCGSPDTTVSCRFIGCKSGHRSRLNTAQAFRSFGQSLRTSVEWPWLPTRLQGRGANSRWTTSRLLPCATGCTTRRSTVPT